MTAICDLNPHVLRYIEMVESGEIAACEEQHLLAAYVRDCFAPEDIYTDARQLEQYLGLAKYFPFEQLFPWEVFLEALHLCTYWRSNGLPRWSDVFCLIGRGGGKDGLIAHEGACLLSPYNGIHGYDVDICANNEEQAMRPLMDVTEAFEDPRHTRKLKRHFYWTKELVRGLKTKSVLRGRTNNPAGRDGMRSGIIIFNEVHQYENYKNINVFTTGLGKKKHPRRGYYTSQGNVRDGVLDDKLEECLAILRREQPDNGLLPFLCRLDSKEEVNDPRNWEKANPSLPYRPELQLEIEKEYREWKCHPNQLPDFMTKRMGLPQSAEASPVTEWDNIAATNRALPAELSGWSCTVGIDYASLRDWASVVLHFRRGAERIDIHHSWLCLQSPDLSRIKAPWQDWPTVTPVDAVEISPELLTEYIAAAAQDYNIRKIALDNFRYALVKKALEGIGFSAEQKTVYLLRPSDIMRVQPVIDSCFNQQLFAWGDDPALRWAANNTKLIRSGRKEGTDTGNYYYAKIEGKSRKTDPFMALAAAMAVENEIPNAIPEDFPELGVIT